MISSSEIGDIIAVYTKHGWLLRRVLLSPTVKGSIRLPEQSIGDAAIIDSDLDALWFSRPPKPGGVAWEIRHLSIEPYALLFTIDEHDAEFEDSLVSAEDVLRTNIASRKVA